MTRLIVFGLFITGLVWIMNLRKFEKETPSNARFDFVKTRDANLAKEKVIYDLTHKKEEVAVVEEVKDEGPLVVLDTPELVKGAELYKKCIVCHGDRGQGKKSQNAPAIGGQFDWYVITQVTNMQNGKRVNKVMNPYIAKLSEQDVKDLAGYISKLPLMGKK